MDKIVKILRRTEAKDWPVESEKILRQAWQQSDKDIKITVEVAVGKRRVAQNRLMWMWHSELASHIETSTGKMFDSEDIHEHVVDKLLPKYAVDIGDNPIIVRTKTSGLGVKVFAEFLTRYEIWVSETYHCRFTQPIDLYMQAVMKDEQ